MKAWVVGGAVRDRLLGLPTVDRDWVVVGGTPEAMLAAGFTPVGRDFPVFLHPQTHEEYALARTERKTGRGYHGFVFHADPEVTLEQDLARRDLTINAIAEDPDSGDLVDPFGGRRDLHDRVLRHVSDAFTEDPVRLLRVARLAARFVDFQVAPQTLALLRRMVASGEVDALVPERVWQELSRGLMQARPDRMIELLRDCGALQRLLPEVDRMFGAPGHTQGMAGDDRGQRLLRVLRRCARQQVPLEVRYACLCHDLDSEPPEASPCDPADRAARAAAAARSIGQRWHVPSECRELAVTMAREADVVHRGDRLDAAAVVALLDRCDAWRRPQRFALLLQGCECAARGQRGEDARPYPQRPRLWAALQAARAVDTASAARAAAAQGLSGPQIGRQVTEARRLAVEALLGAGE